MTDIDKALTYVRELIESTTAEDLGEDEDVNDRQELRRIETRLMKQERMESEKSDLEQRIANGMKECMRLARENAALKGLADCNHDMIDGYGAENMRLRGVINDAEAWICKVSGGGETDFRQKLTDALKGGAWSGGIAAIADERRRQIEQEGWTAEHDDKYDNFELAWAGITYTHHASIRNDRERARTRPSGWPWADAWWKPEDRRRNLVKAGALFAAEIDRIDRAAKKESAVCEHPGCNMPARTELDNEKLCKFHATEWLKGEQQAADDYQAEIDQLGIDYGDLKGGAA
nr:hypothetical protein [uncultured Cohaesibacter sp.]